MSERPFMQLYVSDYLGDTHHFTTEQHGAYLLLLMSMWLHKGKLPNDPKILSKIAHVSLTRWNTISPAILELCQVSDATISQKRLQTELKKLSTRSEKNRESGALGGRAKALKNNNVTLANATLKPSIARASHNHNHIPEPDMFEESSVSSNGTRHSANGTTHAFLAFWKLYPHKVGKAAARAAFDKALKIAPLDEIMAGLQRYANKTDDRQWCNPTTFLNQQRWADEPAFVPQQQPQRSRSNAGHDPGGGGDEYEEYARQLREQEERRNAHK